MADVINKLFDWISGIASDAVNMLPKSPFTFERMAGLETIMGYLNYFIPVGRMVQTAIAWLACIALWYVCSILLRWAKAIE